MTVEEKAKRLRSLAEQMAEVLRDGPAVCNVRVRLYAGQIEEVSAQMSCPHDGSLEALGSVQTDAPFYSGAQRTLRQYRSVTVGGIEFWAIDLVPTPTSEEVSAECAQ